MRVASRGMEPIANHIIEPGPSNWGYVTDILCGLSSSRQFESSTIQALGIIPSEWLYSFATSGGAIPY